MVIVIMGAAGAGKSTIGARLAERLGMVFVDADAFHSPANVAKMAAGKPLDDEQRAGWLATLAGRIDGWLARGEDVVLACSALRASHRRILWRDATRMRLVHLRASPQVLEARLRARKGHFMGPAMLGSQLEALEEPRDAIVIDADARVEVVLAAVERALATPMLSRQAGGG